MNVVHQGHKGGRQSVVCFRLMPPTPYSALGKDRFPACFHCPHLSPSVAFQTSCPWLLGTGRSGSCGFWSVLWRCLRKNWMKWRACGCLHWVWSRGDILTAFPSSRHDHYFLSLHLWRRPERTENSVCLPSLVHKHWFWVEADFWHLVALCEFQQERCMDLHFCPSRGKELSLDYWILEGWFQPLAKFWKHLLCIILGSELFKDLALGASVVPAVGTVLREAQLCQSVKQMIPCSCDTMAWLLASPSSTVGAGPVFSPLLWSSSLACLGFSSDSKCLPREGRDNLSYHKEMCPSSPSSGKKTLKNPPT